MAFSLLKKDAPSRHQASRSHLDQAFAIHLQAVMVSGVQMTAARAISSIGLFFSEPTIAVPIKNHAPHPRDCSSCCYPPHGGASKTPPSEASLAGHWNLIPLKSASLGSLQPFPSMLLRLLRLNQSAPHHETHLHPPFHRGPSPVQLDRPSIPLTSLP